MKSLMRIMRVTSTDRNLVLIVDHVQEQCPVCKGYLMYRSPEEFDPACFDDDVEVIHCEECCDGTCQE